MSPHCPHEVGRKKDRTGIVLQLWHMSHGIAAIEMFIETARRIALLGVSWQEEKQGWLQLGGGSHGPSLRDGNDKVREKMNVLPFLRC